MKLRNLAGAFLAFACAALCGNLRAGNVWEFIPDSPTGVTYQPGEEITFRMRLLTPNYDMPDDKRTPWMLLPNMDNLEVYQTFLTDPENAMGILMGKHPFGIGVVANGKTYSASYVTENVTNESYGTDFTFRYPVQCGDFALPLRLAADKNGTPVNSWDPDSSKASNRYFFFNGPDDTGIWKITTSNGDAFVPQMVGQAEAELTIMEREVLPYNAAGDYLRGFRWTLETLAFDEVTEPGDDGKDYWRVVRGTSRPTIVPTDGFILDSGRKVYVWIAPAGGSDDDPSTWTGWTENDYAVTIPLDGDRNVEEKVFRDPDGTSRKHNVYTFTLAPGQPNYELRELKGLHVGGTARVILSGTPHWNMVGNGSTGTFLTTDYRMASVYCGEQKPTISVTLDNYSTTTAVVFPNANHELRDYTRAERLRVRLEGVDVHEAFKVKLAFDLAGDTAFPTNVIAVSTDEAAGYLDKNLLKGMEVSFAKDASEATESEDGLYLFILGSTTNAAVNPGIAIIPVPDADLTATVQKTNALHVVIKGINPVVTAVNDIEAEPGTAVAVKEIRGGGNLECRVRIEDSYRNLRLLDAGGTDGVYTVTFNRGYGSALTITNNASGGALVPTDYFSDGYAYLDFKVPYTSVTNTYTATFKLKNPDGLESKTYVLTVPVIPPATVTASAPEGKESGDGFYELMESDTAKYRVEFQLSDILEADSRDLWAYLEPANETASNRTDAAFFTVRANGTAGKGVPVDTMTSGKGSTSIDYTLGGIQILDGDGAGDGSGQTARYNVILCTQPTYSNEFVFAGYDGSTTKFTLILDNHEPEFKQLVLSEVISGTTNDIDVITASGKTAANRVHKGNDVIVGPMTKSDWKDVARDIDATNENLMVTRWLVYRVNDSGEKERWDAYYTYGPDEKLVIPGGLTVYGDKDTTYLFEIQIQDKDMRALGTAGLIEDEDEPSGWAYRVYRNLPNFEPDWAGDDEANVWGPPFTFTVVASSKPNVDIVVREEGSTLVQGVPAFTEDQLTPLNDSIYNNDDMRFVVSLAEQFDRKTEVKVKLTLSAVDNMNVNGGFVELAETNVYFVGANRTAEVKVSDFDATYRDGKIQRGYAKYQVKAEVVEPAAAVEKYNATTCQFFVVNRPPRLELGAGSQQFSEYLDNPDLAYDTTKNNELTVDWTATDIHWDLTNISVKATISGGTIVDGSGVEYTTYTYAATNSAVVATNYEDGAYNVAFKFKFSSSGTNTITFVATDKDGDSSERHVLRFAIPETKTLLLYPAKPTQPSTDSDDIADYFSAAGIGYGRVWADGDTKLSAIDKWIHDWTCSEGGVAKVYAMGYLAKEREDGTSPAFVNAGGSNGSPDKDTGYSPADENATFKHLDSFFYRWFAKVVAESGSGSNWTAYKPVPQVSTNRATAAAGSVMSMSFPRKTGMNVNEYNDISALAIFSRELLWSDNMGDINADGVPDSYVVKYKLVDEYAGGVDLNDVNYSEDGKSPNCQDYLPLTGLPSYSKLIPELTSYDNIKDATAFTPRLKIRGYDETDALSLRKRRETHGSIAEIIPGISALNDAADLAGIDGAKPDRKYTNPREDADSTLNYVEWLAWSEFKAANPEATEADWSPERPTDPTKADFDNDGFTDGYEYYVWYRAHVGYMVGDVHKYLTGRAYDPRNPGEGTFISSERIAELFDPRAKGAADNTQDTDNDGLPDLIEFEIGTNPFDFDTDGDGLPDGWELCNVGNLDPLDPASHLDGKNDTERNSDGDAMAISSYALEKTQKPVPAEIEHAKRTTFAVIDRAGIESAEGGMSDGVQWYAVKGAPEDVAVTVTTNAESVWSFESEGRIFISTEKPVLTAEGRLGKALTRDVAFVSVKPEPVWTNGVIGQVEEPEGSGTMVDVEGPITNYVAAALYPVRLEAGAPVRMLFDEAIGGVVTTLAMDIGEKDANACWIYGRGTVTNAFGEVAKTASDYGCLALGRYKGVKAGAIVCALPSDERDVAFLHYLVYQEFGFDPRTAWKAKDPLATRWSKSIDGESVEGITVIQQGGYTGAPSRTRDYANYDEFLVYSFFLNNGCDVSHATTRITDQNASYIVKVWDALTTNPQGPNEILPVEEGGTVTAVTSYGRGPNGADTDEDGVPDGWELYVMSGPKTAQGDYVFAPPYAAFDNAFTLPYREPGSAYSTYCLKESYFSPFLAFAKGTETSNQIYLGGQPNDDTLNEFHEFEGTDSINYYAVAEKEGNEPLSTTVAHDVTHDGEWTWFNKFFPTDPWNVDTDGDSVKDNDEKGAFAYGTPADDGKLWSIPGGGLNPCSIDTDLDGLPDPWEKQYTKPVAQRHIYEGDNPAPFYAKDADGNEIGNPLEGLDNCMDGTVPDAYNVVNGSGGSSSGQTTWTIITSDGRRWSGHVNRDYDRDGLENWQEYLTGTMRCWRYDDPYSPWTAIPKEMYYTYDAKNAKWAWDPKYEKLGCNRDNPDEFWYKTLVDRESGIYNPHLVVDSVCGQYFSKVTNAWDAAYLDSTLSNGKRDGAWYFLYDRIGPDMIKDIWVGTMLDPKRLFGIAKNPDRAPSKYMGCSPLEYDSDRDGMDDYYELFHGLNPLLGESGVNLANEGPCDLVFDAWRGGETGVDGQFEAWGSGTTANWWQLNPKKGLPNGGKSRSLVPGGYDFEVYPWLNGLQMADPDGDDMRNVYEAIMPRFADDAWHHTDPTPLWMTDTSYADSIVRRFFCLPTRFDEVPTANESFFGNDGAEYFFRDMSAGWVAGSSGNVFLPFVPDFWDLSASGAYNWMYSFEENEGFDTDHDGTGDTEEASSRTRAATDPQDFDSPRRRQAMYFAGAEWPSVLQTMPEETERYPVATETYPDDASFRQYTVECWVKPDAPEGAEFPDMTILERAIWTGLSNPGDEEFMRKNFQLGIKNNRWYTKYDPDGTLKDTVVEVFSTGTASTGWHHLAATYDGVQLVLYVDGTAQTPMKSSLAPERGMSALALRRNWGIGLQPGDYWFDREYAYKAFIIGARAKGRTELPAAVRETGYTTLDLAHGVDFSRYDGFFKGYVDEISVWDGARSFDDIYADYSQRIRLDRTAAIANRSEFYKKWSVGGRRYAADLSGTSSSLVPELRYHWSFDALFGAENPGQVAIEPHGFSAAGKPILSRPKDYVVSWWSQVVGDSDSIYAGNLDWVPWIHNTVAHLPRFDTTTLDSMFWSENFCGATNGTYAFPRTAEPVSRWTQFAYNGVDRASRYQTASSRHHLVFEQGWSPSNTTTLVTQFEFTGRHLNQTGDDLLPLGGAFVRYVDTMWDDQGASSMWEQTGEDSTANGLPDWWEEYADQNYRPKGMDPGSEIDWNTELVRDGVRMTAGEAYLRDLAAGMYVDADGAVHPTESDREAGILKTPFEQTAKSDGLIPDWWKSLYKIDNEGPLTDNDNDGLDNYVEYMASELLPFGFRLNPLMPRTDTVTLDYFRKVGRLYVGEMLTDHDQMEDHWERSLANAAIADPTLWDALKDVDGDGWDNFAENRYNEYRMSTLAQLASHAVGDDEALDAPIPSVTLTVRYNGSNLGAAKDDAAGGGKSGENEDGKEASKLPNLVVRAYTKTGGKPDAEYVLAPGQTVDREVYIGGWEDRVVRGTMSPGNIDIGSVNIKFAQIPQADIYSWTDENGRHLAGTYAEFKDAFDRNPDIIQNIQDFTWLELVAPVNQYTSSDRAVTVSREKLTQTGYIAVYGERVGTVDLTTGEFEFDLAAMNNLRVNYTYDGGKGPEAAWSYKEAIFKITYSAKVPAVQADRFQVTLAKADTGFMKGGKNSFTAFFDNDGNGEYTPGEPFGVLNDVEIGWSGRTLELELTDMSAITPRIDLWSAETDRAALTAADGQTNVFIAVASAPAKQCRVSVVRHRFNGRSPFECGVTANTVAYAGDFTSDARKFLHEGDFLTSGSDIDWDHLYADAVAEEGTYRLIGALTNVTYLIVFDGQIGANSQGTDTKALSAVITRRFEVQRRKPTPCPERMVFNRARPTFAWTIEGENPWAAKFGTTYTAFKVRVRTLSGDLVYESDVTRLPAKDSDGVYTWTAPLYVGARTAQGVVFDNLTDYTWEIALYNAKFSTDTVLSADSNGVVNGNPFSARQVFRMNVTHQDLSSCSIAVAVRYAGPAMQLADRIRVQAFESPDFTGDPVAEKIVGTADQVVVLDGLAEGDYFIRAYIDTNGNGVHDEWESWGYLCERDLANKADIFNPVIARSRFNADERNVRTVHIEDCDTDGDWFPDVWEAEQNGGVFVAFKSGKGQGPVDGNAELIGVNTNLDANLDISAFPMLEALGSTNGFALLTGIEPAKVRTTVAASGATRFSVDNKVDSVTISKLEFDADGNVVISLDAKTSAGAVDPAVAAIYDLDLSKTVTCRIYRKTDLASSGWGEPVAEETVTVGAGPVTIEIAGEKSNQAYYRAEIVEK